MFPGKYAAYVNFFIYICPVILFTMNILVYAVVILLIAVFIFFSYPKIKLFLIKTLYSKYSYRYLSTFKSFSNKSPFSYCIKDEVIYHILPFLEIEKNAEVYPSKHPISFGNIAFGTSYKKVIKEKKKPICFNAFRIMNYDFKIIGYKDVVLDMSTRILYYFVDNVFFMGEYVFKSPDDKKLEKILNAISEKYLAKPVKKSNRFYIEVNPVSKLFFRDNGFNILIAYANFEDEQVKTKLTEAHNYLRNIGETLKQKDYRHKVNLI